MSEIADSLRKIGFSKDADEIDRFVAAVPAPRQRIAFGPWSPNCGYMERLVHLRTLAAIVYVFSFGHGRQLFEALRDCDPADEMALEHARMLFDALPALKQRKIISTFAAVTWRGKGGGSDGRRDQEGA
jgi:hypothetical protein